MSREFNNGVTTDLMTYATGPPAISGAITILAVARIMATADDIWISVIENDDGGAVNNSLGRHSSGVVYFANSLGTTTGAAATWTDSDNWCVVAATRPAGAAQTVTTYCIPIGGATKAGPGSTTLGDEGAGTDRLRFGGPSDPAHIRLAVVAEFTSVLSQGQLEGIASAKTTASVAALSPVGLWDDSDAFVNDLVGSCDQTAINGTTDNADDPAGWVYGLGGGLTKTGSGIIGP